MVKKEKKAKDLIPPIVEPEPAFVNKGAIKSLTREPSLQKDYKPNYLTEAQFAHQEQVKVLPDKKPSTADLVTRGLMYAGDVVNRLGKSTAKIEEVISEVPKKKGGRPKKQTSKDKEDEKLAMEVKDTKEALAAVAKELTKHEEESEDEMRKGVSTKVVKKVTRKPRYAKGSEEAKAHMAKLRAARKKKEDK